MNGMVRILLQTEMSMQCAAKVTTLPTTANAEQPLQTRSLLVVAYLQRIGHHGHAPMPWCGSGLSGHVPCAL